MPIGCGISTYWYAEARQSMLVTVTKLYDTDESKSDISINEGEKKASYLRGLARTRWPIVTKLVSWLDINHARDETLNNFQKTKKKQKDIMIITMKGFNTLRITCIR